jgi:hypothetical protein
MLLTNHLSRHSRRTEGRSFKKRRTAGDTHTRAGMLASSRDPSRNSAYNVWKGPDVVVLRDSCGRVFSRLKQVPHYLEDIAKKAYKETYVTYECHPLPTPVNLWRQKESNFSSKAP